MVSQQRLERERGGGGERENGGGVVGEGNFGMTLR